MGAVCFGYMIAHLKVALLVCLTRRPLPGPAKYHLWNPRCRRYLGSWLVSVKRRPSMYLGRYGSADERPLIAQLEK